MKISAIINLIEKLEEKRELGIITMTEDAHLIWLVDIAEDMISKKETLRIVN